jgi:hypothetical protein
LVEQLTSAAMFLQPPLLGSDHAGVATFFLEGVIYQEKYDNDRLAQ